ncbi:multi-sensor signal transduction histidine kinase [Desulfovibrio sp. X2]|uniref:PAS domain S-box protein n=1 Tax=Desulfovibrio sp. X2 TaxID=941449 RepID=UPI000358A35F|nr:PAS domain S-box protein [Desulfovibrio sp. X2]EPR42111.1 multi-sensor signal transduction histidine kinase [Desulfovibrio sp. X2]
MPAVTDSATPMRPTYGAWSRGRRARFLLVAAVGYFVANKIALFFPDAESILTAVWPAAGVGLASLLLAPRRLWPAVLAAVFLAGNAANLLSGRPLANSLGFMTANVLESLLGAWLMRLWCGRDIRFNRVKDVGALIAVSVLANAATACVGAGTAALAGVASFWSLWATWWVADGLGMLLVTPLVVGWAETARAGLARKPGRAAEHAVFLLLWCAAAWWTFQPHAAIAFLAPKPYVLAALILWPALRMGHRSVAFALAVLTCLAVLSPAVQSGPLLWGGETPYERILHLQVFLGVIAATSLLLTAAVAERTTAERALREKQALLAAIVEGTPDAVFATDTEGRHILVNSAGAALFGRTPDEVLGRDIAELFPPDVAPRIRELTRAAVRAAGPGTREESIPVAEGLERSFIVTRGPLSDADGEPIGMFGIARDVTEMRATQEALQESERRFRHAFEQAGVGMFHGDAQGNFLLANRTFAEITGYSADELTRMTYRDLSHPEDAAKDVAAVEALVSGKCALLHGQKRYVRKDGSEVWVNRTAASVYDEFGRLKGVMGVVEDITERRRLEELRAQVERTMRHDLRTPAGNALALAGLLRQENGLDEGQKRMLALLEQAGRDMLDTLDGSLEIYKIETGQYACEPEIFDCLALVRGMAEAMVRTERFPRVKLDIRLDGAVPDASARCLCLGHPNLARLALQNLLVNAMEASPKGGTVHVSLACGEDCRVEIRNAGAVPAAIRDRFFDKYATSGKTSGTGIGTYSARLMVRAQKGDVTMRTSDGQDETVVAVHLPRC